MNVSLQKTPGRAGRVGSRWERKVERGFLKMVEERLAAHGGHTDAFLFCPGFKSSVEF